VAQAKDAEAQGKTAYERFSQLMDEAETKYRAADNPFVQVAWFREWRGMMEYGFKLGMEAAKDIGASKEWQNLRAKILVVLDRHPKAKRDLIEMLAKERA
jgi:hypothetical protein